MRNRFIFFMMIIYVLNFSDTAYSLAVCSKVKTETFQIDFEDSQIYLMEKLKIEKYFRRYLESEDYIYTDRIPAGIDKPEEEDILALALLIDAKINISGEKHLVDILEKVKVELIDELDCGEVIEEKDCEKFIASLEDLIGKIRQPSDTQEFPYHNLAYQALLLVIRTWPKKDLHSHQSPTISPYWLIGKLKQKQDFYRSKFVEQMKIWEQKDESQRSEIEKTVIYQLINYLLKLNDWFFIGNSEILTIFRTYRAGEDALDIPIDYAETELETEKMFFEAMENLVYRYFKDGVRQLELRFNPCKFKDPIAFLNNVYSCVKKIEKIANKQFGGRHEVKFLFCFNQKKYGPIGEKFEITKDRIDVLFRNLETPSYFFKEIMQRITGVDLAGIEIEKTVRSDWRGLINRVFGEKKKGTKLQLSAHAGDRENVPRQGKGFNKDILGHLAWFKEALSVGFERFGHATLLRDKVAQYKADGTLDVKFKELKAEEKQDVDSILEQIKEKGIRLETMPKKEWRCIKKLKKYGPMYYWLEQGVLPENISPCADGWIYMGTTLSEWALWGILGSPYGKDLNPLVSVDTMKKMILFDDKNFVGEGDYSFEKERIKNLSEIENPEAHEIIEKLENAKKLFRADEEWKKKWKSVKDISEEERATPKTFEYSSAKLISLPADREVVVVGDIHGHYKALKAILDQTDFENSNLTYLFLGDYVDRGTRSLDVWMELIELKQKYPDRIFLLKGNHEDQELCAQGKNSLLEELEKRFKDDAYTILDKIDKLFYELPYFLMSYNKRVNKLIFAMHGCLPLKLQENSGEIEPVIDVKDMLYYFENKDQFLWNDSGTETKVGTRGSNGFYFVGADMIAKFEKEANVNLLVLGGHRVVLDPKFAINKKVATIFSTGKDDSLESGHDEVTKPFFMKVDFGSDDLCWKLKDIIPIELDRGVKEKDVFLYDRYANRDDDIRLYEEELQSIVLSFFEEALREFA